MRSILPSVGQKNRRLQSASIKQKWAVYYFWNSRWHKDNFTFPSAKKVADYAGRVFGTECHWKIKKIRRKRK